MFNLLKTPFIRVNSIDYNMSNGIMNYDYHGKLVSDDNSVIYVPEDGRTYYTVMYGFTLNDGTRFNAGEFLESIRQPSSTSSESRLDVQTLTHLKASGHSIEEIVKLRREGVI